MTDSANDPTLLELAKRFLRSAFFEGVKNGRQNRSHPSERPRLEEGKIGDMERQAYSVGWQHGQSNPDAEADDAACENYMKDVFETEDSD
jgi:hypothetical protein